MAAGAHPQRGQLFSLGAFYFGIFAALGAFFPFLPLLLAARGFEADRISWVMVLLPASSLLAPPLWGFAADLLQARTPLLRAAAALAGLSLLALLPAWPLWTTLLAMGLHTFFRAPLTSLADAVAHGLLGAQRDRFGRIRVWGSVGFAAAVAIMGALDGSSRPALLLAVPCALLLMAAAATFGIGRQARAGARPRLGQALAPLGQPRMLLFLLATGCYYTGHATYDAFYSLHLRQGLNLGDGFVGAAWSIGVVAEIGVMLIGPRLVPRHAAMLVLSAAVAVGRWWGIAAVTSPLALLALQPLHGVTFGLWYLSMVKAVQDQAPDALRAAHQSLALSVVGLGMVTGYLAGGRVMRRAGGARVFQLAAACAGLAGVLFLVGALFDRRDAARRRRYSSS